MTYDGNRVVHTDKMDIIGIANTAILDGIAEYVAKLCLDALPDKVGFMLHQDERVTCGDYYMTWIAAMGIGAMNRDCAINRDGS